MPSQPERLYALARSGEWIEVLAQLARASKTSAQCARYVRDTSGWTFLHQAAYFGREDAVRALIAAGASLASASKGGEVAADIAAKRGFTHLARLLLSAAESGRQLWSPSPDPHLLPSSSAWAEASERRATDTMNVGYAGGMVVIPRGSRYFVDTFERVLVGWHGSYDPPRGMDDESLVNGAETGDGSHGARLGLDERQHTSASPRTRTRCNALQ